MYQVIYYNTKSSPFTMFVVEVPSTDYSQIPLVLDQEDENGSYKYPWPEADIMIMKDGKIIDQVNLYSGHQRDIGK